MKEPIRILLAEDHGIMRDGLRLILESSEDLTIVGEAKNGRAALALAGETSPDVVIMDISMPELNGIEATRQIKSLCPQAKIIGLSVHRQSQFIQEMIKAGASGYVPKQCAAEELIVAIQTVVADKMYISPEVTEELMEAHLHAVQEAKSNAYSKLTGREREVLQLLAEGNSVKEIGNELGLSVPTVHSHRQHLMQKLDLHSIAELTKYAIREGLTTLED